MSTPTVARRGDTPTDDDTHPLAAFDVPALWRAEIITDFRLRSAERCAAASPLPGLPQLLESMLTEIDAAGNGLWIDVGGGLGGIASWVTQRLGRRVIVADRAGASVDAARRLFPALPAVAADGAALPFVDHAAAVGLLNGIVSLLDDPGDVLRELRRVLIPGGIVVAVDLWSDTSSSFRMGPNTFRSIEDFRELCALHGLDDTHLAIADTSVGWWSSAAEQVHDEMIRRHRNDDGFDEWYHDQCHLREVLASGQLLAVGMLLRSRDASDAE